MWIAIIFGILLVLLTIAIVIFNNVLKSKHEEKFAELSQSVECKSVYYGLDQAPLHAVIAGDENNIPILLIHGSPGSWDAWMDIMIDQDLLQNYYFISVDRPGYGRTQIPAKRYLADQANALESMLNSLAKPAIVIGHSYGGAVGQQIAINFENRITSLIHVASTLAPQYQQAKWYNRLGNLGLVRSLLSQVWNSSNTEMLGLEKGLQTMEPMVGELTVPIYVIQGKKDVLVPFKTIEYYKKISNPSLVEYIIDEKQNHFIPWEKPSLIKTVLLEMLEINDSE